MSDPLRLELIDWHKECATLLTAGLDRMPPKPTESTPVPELET